MLVATVAGGGGGGNWHGQLLSCPGGPAQCVEAEKVGGATPTAVCRVTPPPLPVGGCGRSTCAWWCCQRPTGWSSASTMRECQHPHNNTLVVLMAALLLTPPRHMSCGCAVVSLVLKLFGPLISESMGAQPSTGVDISREER